MNYTKLLATVERLIANAGRVVTFEQLDDEAIDSSKPWRGPGEPTALLVDDNPAVFVPPSGFDFGKELVQDELLARCEQVCLTAPSTVLDLNNCTCVVDGGVRWAVVWAQELKPADVSLLFAIGVKR